MAARGVFHLDVNVQPEWGNPKFVGLLKGRTGVAVCLLYLRGIQSPRFLELHSLEDVENEILAHENPWDKEAWRTVLSFFEAEGELLHVAALPISGSGQTRVAEMLGHDRGIRTRSGMHALKSFLEYADLVVVPQASRILDLQEHRFFYQRLLEEIGALNHFFFLVDFPRHAPLGAIADQWKGFCFADAAAYAPWVIFKNEANPPALTVAAAIQQNDIDFGLSDLPANRRLKGNPLPMFDYQPREIRKFQDQRINVVQRVGDQAKIWGGLTLADPCEPESRFISSRRALLAAKQAVEEVCSPFIMEPLRPDTLPSRVEANLSSIFARVTKFFDPDAKVPFKFNVYVQPQEDEDVLVVDMKYWVPYVLNEVSLTLGLNG